MSTHDLRDMLDGLPPSGPSSCSAGGASLASAAGVAAGNPNRLDVGIIAGASLLDSANPQSYKRKVRKNMDRRSRFRTQPVTFMEIKEVDEDNPEPGMTGGPGADDGEAAVGGSGQALDSGSSVDIASIAEQHREKAKSQQDLKRQFEEFSRNLSLHGGRARHHHHHHHNRPKKKLQIPEISVEDSLGASSGLDPAEAAEEAEDTVGRLTPVGLSAASGSSGMLLLSSPASSLMPDAEVDDIDFPQGFAFKNSNSNNSSGSRQSL